MTTVISFKVPEGIVLSADSAMTVHREHHGDNRYDGYHKLSVLCGLPAGTAMWGRGTIDRRSVPSLVSEFTVTKVQQEPKENWTPQRLATELYEFLSERDQSSAGAATQAPLHMLVAGYAPGSFHGEVWRFALPGQPPRVQADRENLSIAWFGVTEAIQTLWWGHSPRLGQILRDEGVDGEVIQRVMARLRKDAAWGPERLDFTMPLQNAVDLVAFLMAVEIAHERYRPGLARSAPPIDLLVVRPEGAQWVRHKEIIAPPSILGGFLP